MSIERHEFYCTKCGKRGIPILRKTCRFRKRFHIKKLYCIYCDEYVNHIECRDDSEVEAAKEYIMEAQAK